MRNRIQTSLVTTAAMLARVHGVTTIKRIERNTQLATTELQQLRSLAKLAPTYGWLTPVEVRTVIDLINNYDQQPLAVKYVLQTIYVELATPRNQMIAMLAA